MKEDACEGWMKVEIMIRNKIINGLVNTEDEMNTREEDFDADVE